MTGQLFTHSRRLALVLGLLAACFTFSASANAQTEGDTQSPDEQPMVQSPMDNNDAEQPSADVDNAAQDEPARDGNGVSDTDADQDGADTDTAGQDDSATKPDPSDADGGATSDGDTSAGGPADGQTPPSTSGIAADDAEEESNIWMQLAVVAVVIALIVVPIFLGNYLANALKMPDHSWRISLAIGTIAAAAVVAGYGIATDGLRGGPDLVGGITLIYELEDASKLVSEEEANQAQSVPGKNVQMDKLIGALSERINPAGTKEITIRSGGGGQVEIIVPRAGPEELEQLKELITNLGELEFRIVASPNDPRDADVIRLAEALGPREKNVFVQGEENPIAKWVPFDEQEFGRIGESVNADGDPTTPIVKRIGKGSAGQDVLETVVLIDRYNVTGDYLSNTSQTFDNAGSPAVAFSFDARGAARFGNLTAANLPDQQSGMQRSLGILLNGQLRSAPGIRQKISSQGIIEGRFTVPEIENLINILNAGSLPAALNKTPLSESVVSPFIGAATVRQATWAIGISLAIVLAFMIVYYRFAGVIACLALVANLLLVVAAMIFFKAAFTLPGLAGLVLTVGMSVDANVLIFERIREELARGAALRMAIRNGFDRAKTTIVDANLTTLIVATVLFWIGTDVIKGFATTLFVGIIMSMYTAIFCSRIVFEIAERRRWISEIKMMRLVGHTSIDFIGKRGVAAICSGALIVVGMIAVIQRGGEILNIDFTGGVKTSIVLAEDAAMPQADVRKALEDSTDLESKNLLVVEQIDDQEQSRQRNYDIYARILDTDPEVTQQSTDDGEGSAVEYMQSLIQQALGEKLVTYEVSHSPIEVISTTEDTAASNDDTQADQGGAESDSNVADGTANGAANSIAVQTTLTFPEAQAVSHATVSKRMQQVLTSMSIGEGAATITNDAYRPGSSERFSEWTVRLDLDQQRAEQVLAEFERVMNASPIFPQANSIGDKVAGDMGTLAAWAIFLSLACIVGYIWLRFQQVMFGLAAVVALVHDVMVTLGMIGISAWAVGYVPPLATFLQLEPFQISLTVVAAFLTIIGYSLNDTIVVFDRIREVRGKSPNVTAEMINTSINQTLSRTLLTSLTTFMVVSILYFFGGPGIHGFAFALVIGVIVGTYSSIFVASPALLWMSKSAKDA